MVDERTDAYTSAGAGAGGDQSDAPSLPVLRVLLAADGKVGNERVGLRGDRLAIGRPGHVGDGLALADSKVSRIHAVIERRDGAFVVVDQGSRNGTWVNRRRVPEHRLAAGDVLRIGHTVLHFDYEPEE